MKSNKAWLLGVYFLISLPAVAQQTETFLPKLFNHEKRIFLIFSPSPDDNRYEKQMNVLIENQEVLTRAEVALYKLFEEDGYNANNQRIVTAQVLKLRQQFDIADEEFALMYVTVNGQVQMKRNQLSTITEILTLLDTTEFYRPEYQFNLDEQ